MALFLSVDYGTKMTGLLAQFHPWLDLFWIPVALAVVHPEQRVKAVLFAGACVLMLRLQVEMMGQIGYGGGFFGWWDKPLLYRGMIGYAVAMVFYLLMTRLSPRTDVFVMMAASITIFIAAFCVTSALMVL